MDDLRVPKRRLPVEVVLPGGATPRGGRLLDGWAPGHGGPETVSDLLNGRDEFIPAFDEEAAAMAFLHRQAVAVARLPAGSEPDPAGEVTIPTEHEVEVALADGSRLRGFVSFVLPPERGRLVDFLNEKDRFFRLAEPGGVALVSRAHVASVTLVTR
jgi:hypothetical protein